MILFRLVMENTLKFPHFSVVIAQATSPFNMHPGVSASSYESMT